MHAERDFLFAAFGHWNDKNIHVDVVRCRKYELKQGLTSLVYGSRHNSVVNSRGNFSLSAASFAAGKADSFVHGLESKDVLQQSVQQADGATFKGPSSAVSTFSYQPINASFGSFQKENKPSSCVV